MAISMGAMLLAGGCAGLGYPWGMRPDESPPASPSTELIATATGTGQGFRGPITVAVLLDGHTLLGIEILNHWDDPYIGGAAMEALAELALDGNTTDLDAISGATESSMGFLSAIEDALLQRGVSD